MIADLLEPDVILSPKAFLKSYFCLILHDHDLIEVVLFMILFT